MSVILAEIKKVISRCGATYPDGTSSDTELEETARAIIEILRDPTEQMCEAGARYFHDSWRKGHAKEDTSMRFIWEAMLDSALTE